jgi:hypothetical protein
MNKPAKYCSLYRSLTEALGVFQARKHLDQPEEFSKLADPKLQSVNQESLGIVCNVVNLCIDPEPWRRPSMSMIAAILEEGIDLSSATLLRDSSLAWAEAELAIS